jgi:hypothetical protein
MTISPARCGCAALLGLLMGAGTGVTVHLSVPPSAKAVELQGQTWFAKPPWKVELRNYYWYVMQSGGEYYFTVNLPEQAGVGLGGLVIRQIRGVDTNFSFDAARTRAFVGLPRREGAAVPVEATFDPDARRFEIRFPKPPQPGQTVTVALRPWHNPSQADSYVFGVQALPAGVNPVPASLGVATLPIYEGIRF